MGKLNTLIFTRLSEVERRRCFTLQWREFSVIYSCAAAAQHPRGADRGGRHQRRYRAARLARSPVEGRPRRHMEHFVQRQLAADLRHPAG